MELQHVHEADRDLTIECLAGASVVQGDLARAGQARKLQHVLDLGLGRAVEHRRRKGHAVLQVLGQHADLVVVQRLDILRLAGSVVDPGQELAHFRGVLLHLEQLGNSMTQSLRRPSEMDLEDLSDVHP